MQPQEFVAKAQESIKDYRTIQHDMASFPSTKGGITYAPQDILNQSKVGICTAIATVQNANKVLGKVFCEDFQYLLQKKFIDNNWDEGSAIFSAMKVATKYGFLLASDWTHTVQGDRESGYANYIAKLQAIDDAEIQRLISLCTSKLTGYAQVDVSNKEIMHSAISSSRAGILCRYNIGKEWWTSPTGNISWSPSDIDPLRLSAVTVGGHAIGMTAFDSGIELMANTWSPNWSVQGNAHVDTNKYSPTEAFIPYYDFTPVLYKLPASGTWKHTFNQQLEFGTVSDEVKNLQIALMIDGSLPLLKVVDMGTFGNKTLKAVNLFQTKYGISPANRAGAKTLNQLNLIYAN